MAKWLVTGGAGFIGSHVVDELLDRGEDVVVLDDFSTGRRGNLASSLKKIELAQGDLRDPRTLRRILKGVDFVSHQAALRSVPRSIDDPISTNDVNVSGTLSLLWGCLKSGVKRLIYASSSSVYGDSTLLPQREIHRPSPISPYAVSKLAGEHYCRVFSKTFGLEAVCLRYFNVFGPRQDPRSRYAAVIPLFMRAVREGEPLTVFGDGRQSRDFTFVKNVALANWRAARAKDAAGHVFNIACGENHSILELVSELERIAGFRLKCRHLPPRRGDVRKTWADISSARRLMGWTPTVPFGEGLRLTWASFSEAAVFT